MTTAVLLKRRASQEELTAGLAFVQYVDLQGRRLQANMALKLGDVFEDIGRDAATLYRQAPKAMKVGDARTVEYILGRLELTGRMRRQVTPMYGGTFNAAASLVMDGYEQTLNVPIAIGVRDQVQEHLLREGGLRAGLLDLSGDAKRSIYAGLEAARAQGLGIPQTAATISEHVSAGRFVNAGPQYRATMIARTEVRYASNMSVVTTGRAAGFEQYIAFDNRLGTDDTDCVIRDGETFTDNEATSESAGEHPNGTLSFSPVPRTSGPTAPAGPTAPPTELAPQGRDPASAHLPDADTGTINHAGFTESDIDGWTKANYQSNFEQLTGATLDTGDIAAGSLERITHDLSLAQAKDVAKVLMRAPKLGPALDISPLAGTRLSVRGMKLKDMQKYLSTPTKSSNGVAFFSPSHNTIVFSDEYMVGGWGYPGAGRFGPAFGQETVAHEWGHATEALFQIEDDLTLLFNQGVNFSDSSISWYAKTNQAEFVAEHYAAYWAKPVLYQQRWPEMFKILESNGFTGVPFGTFG